MTETSKSKGKKRTYETVRDKNGKVIRNPKTGKPLRSEVR